MTGSETRPVADSADERVDSNDNAQQHLEVEQHDEGEDSDESDDDSFGPPPLVHPDTSDLEIERLLANYRLGRILYNRMRRRGFRNSDFARDVNHHWRAVTFNHNEEKKEDDGGHQEEYMEPVD